MWPLKSYPNVSERGQNLNSFWPQTLSHLAQQTFLLFQIFVHTPLSFAWFPQLFSNHWSTVLVCCTHLNLSLLTSVKFNHLSYRATFYFSQLHFSLSARFYNFELEISLYDQDAILPLAVDPLLWARFHSSELDSTPPSKIQILRARFQSSS